MSRTIDIDTEKLLEEIEKLESAKNKIEEILNASTDGNKKLNEDWSSDTSKVVDEEFKRFDQAGKDYIEKLDGHINYLKDVVSNSYIEYEEVENQLIDDNIATN